MTNKRILLEHLVHQGLYDNLLIVAQDEGKGKYC
jgi:hypothetical protein